MARRSLQHHILRLMTSTLLGLAIAIMVAVWFSTYTHVQDQIRQDLQIGSRVLHQSLQNREQQLLVSAEVLTADFGFKQAVATLDASTVESALENHGARINADLMALVYLDGEVVASTTHALESQSIFPEIDKLQQALDEGGLSSFMQLQNELYQVMVLPVRAPAPVGIAIIGFRLNEAVAQQLKNITSLDATIVAGHSNQTILSTLPDAHFDLEQTSSHWLDYLPFSQNARSSSLAIPLSETPPVTVYLTASLTDVLEKFDVLQLEIAGIALLATLLALMGGILFGRKLARPMQALASLASDISSGHYRREVEVSGNIIEVGQLMSAFNRMQEDLSEREARIIYQAHHDPLTGLINRQHAIVLLDDMLQLNRKQGFSILVLNVVDFRAVNDTFGHQVGDQCLRSISNRLQDLNYPQQLAARLVGDEFLLIHPDNLFDLPTLQQHLKAIYLVQDLEISLNFAFGVACYPADADNATSLIQKASIALDMARRERLEIAHYDRKVEETHLKRLLILADLKAALQANDGQLRMYYQPKIDARTLDAHHFEALIRWIHPEQGFVPPDTFIPLAEQAGLINALTEWVVEAVITQIALWQQQGFKAQVAVNLSAQDLSRPLLLEHVNGHLQRLEVKPSSLSFEITESELMRNPEEAIELLKKFREQGFILAIDDFGTGYSSLSQLKHMPVNELKIDRSFVMQLDQAKDDQIIVRSTIELAHSFNLEVVAEGVENAATFALLQQWGANWVQGYHFSRPLPASDVLPWIKNFNPQQAQKSVQQ